MCFILWDSALRQKGRFKIPVGREVAALELEEVGSAFGRCVCVPLVVTGILTDCTFEYF